MISLRSPIMHSIGLVALALFVAFFPGFRQEAESVWHAFQEPVAEPGVSSAVESVIVERVVDGDTFVITGGERVRLIGVDAPESVKPNSPVECFGHEASMFLKTLLEGKAVRLERDVSERDVFGRLLRYVYLGDELVNETLVRSGYATVVSYPPDVREIDHLKAIERFAREEHTGLWDPARCPTP